MTAAEQDDRPNWKTSGLEQHLSDHDCGAGGEPFYGFINCPEAKRMYDTIPEDLLPEIWEIA